MKFNFSWMLIIYLQNWGPEIWALVKYSRPIAIKSKVGKPGYWCGVCEGELGSECGKVENVSFYF